MFRNSLNQQRVSNEGATNDGDIEEEEEVGDEYYEFDGAKLEIKHNATIRQSEVSIGPKITTTASHSSAQPSILEGSDSPHSPVGHDTNPFNRMAEESSTSGEDSSSVGLFFISPVTNVRRGLRWKVNFKRGRQINKWGK